MATKIATTKPGKFEIKGNWAYLDSLNGIQIINKDKIRLTWPNGDTENVIAVVSNSTDTVSDMGNPCTIPISKAYMSLKHKGSQILVRFVDCPHLKGEFLKDVLKDDVNYRFREKTKQ